MGERTKPGSWSWAVSEEGSLAPEIHVLSDCREEAGWTTRGSASEFFIPKRRATLMWSKGRMGDGIPRAEVFRLESRGS